jgi:hypothetical protein
LGKPVVSGTPTPGAVTPGNASVLLAPAAAPSGGALKSQVMLYTEDDLSMVRLFAVFWVVGILIESHFFIFSFTACNGFTI